ncbi:type VI secretion protein [Salmonella enterica subsp. arizonae]|uniref:Type VI secretion protein n=1 Tax=Salmonella enterica subsp. arizonae TaxID=59203 RepID=A0A379SGB6_SALER|nr:type VI secretion protein [Salmonella enterica subsp. arizonae]
MGGQNRPARPDVDAADGVYGEFSVDDMNFRRQNFFALVDSIYRFTGKHDDISLATDPDKDVVRFEADTRIAFPGSDVVEGGTKRSWSICRNRGVFRATRQSVAITRLLSG